MNHIEEFLTSIPLHEPGLHVIMGQCGTGKTLLLESIADLSHTMYEVFVPGDDQIDLLRNPLKKLLRITPYSMTVENAVMECHSLYPDYKTIYIDCSLLNFTKDTIVKVEDYAKNNLISVVITLNDYTSFKPIAVSERYLNACNYATTVLRTLKTKDSFQVILVKSGTETLINKKVEYYISDLEGHSTRSCFKKSNSF